jgi:ketosteroid isomerase-like protein/quercetin dioxygenase-like cupin family protein
MKRTTKTLALIATLAATAHTTSAQSRDEAAVRAASQAWQSYIANQQLDSLVALHLPNAILMMANSPPIMGSNGIRSGWGEMIKLPSLKMGWTPQHIEITSPTSAQEFGTYTDSYMGPNGIEADTGTYVTLWKKVNGKWRVALDAPVSSRPLASTPTETTEFVARGGSSLAWSDFASPGFAPGAKITVLQGNPASSGQFVLRLSFPDGYQVPLHWHPTTETVTVISGAGDFGMGNAIDPGTAHGFTAGDFVSIPPRHAHWLSMHAPTVVQVSGNGPFQLNLGSPR